MTRRKRENEREKARRFFQGLSREQRFLLGDELVLGTFEWRDWGLSSKPSAAFLDELDQDRIEWEERQSNPDRGRNRAPTLEAPREFSDAVRRSKQALDAAENALRSRDLVLAADLLLEAAQALGVALGHLHHIANVRPEVLGRYRGQHDRLQALQRAFRQRLFEPSGELRFNPARLRRRLS